MSKFPVYAAVCLLFLTISCNRSAVSGEVLPGEFLFSLDIGVLENEIDLFHRGGTLPEERNSVFMYRGIIFIANSLGNKIMEFSSYGDLISLIYNAEENPRPLLLSSRPREGNIVNKAAHSFPFRNIGEISVSSENVLLAADTVAPGQEGFDLETGAAFQHIIHRFTSEGDYLDYIGQEGVGGTPFSFIVSMNVTARNELVVLTRSSHSYKVFWYNKEGKQLFEVMLDEAHLPAGKTPADFPNIAEVFPDPEKYWLYLHINYDNNESEGVDSLVYVLDLSTEKYSSKFGLDTNRQALPGDEGMDYVDYPYQFIGVAEGGNLFFISRNSAFEQSLAVFDFTGVLKVRRILRVENPDIFFSDYQVSQEGIITALMSDPDSADVYWWRTDRLLEPLRAASRGGNL